jgi:hypothetical protein
MVLCQLNTLSFPTVFIIEDAHVTMETLRRVT